MSTPEKNPRPKIRPAKQFAHFGVKRTVTPPTKYARQGFSEIRHLSDASLQALQDQADSRSFLEKIRGQGVQDEKTIEEMRDGVRKRLRKSDMRHIRALKAKTPFQEINGESARAFKPSLYRPAINSRQHDRAAYSVLGSLPDKFNNIYRKGTNEARLKAGLGGVAAIGALGLGYKAWKNHQEKKEQAEAADGKTASALMRGFLDGLRDG